MFLFVWNITMDLEDFKVNFTGNFADEGKTLMSACNIKYYNTKCLVILNEIYFSLKLRPQHSLNNLFLQKKKNYWEVTRE